MQENYPQANFKEVYAAIGGTGSDLGVFRLQEHVLQFKPDLLFVEFAVNDNSQDPDRIIRAMEGIVWQTWDNNPNTDICFVYTIQEIYLETETNGKLQESAQTMELVADKYGIPSINFGFEVAKKVKQGKLIFTNFDSEEINGIPVFCPDDVYPYVETGHRIYNSVLSKSFETIQENDKTKVQKHKLSKPMNPGYFSDTKMFDFPKVKLSRG
ncbi:hypothetical protein GM418_27265 [Maribellus comscasis]|uniref:SGNH hydrolase-type esterase domain-containing protein n=1 Tax=Maribellus comscasis TaxID=2681766 RepID=A0A6I6K1A2_9BACT|nr:SGNH/GDSL hydrolase family protein [Maribellus comscasis]QGY47230.1 hypothetical protein GM418_27265 [Maribellus comscasis]